MNTFGLLFLSGIFGFLALKIGQANVFYFEILFLFYMVICGAQFKWRNANGQKLRVTRYRAATLDGRPDAGTMAMQVPDGEDVVKCYTRGEAILRLALTAVPFAVVASILVLSMLWGFTLTLWIFYE